ncbi:MAG TPA: ATP-binding protein [Candidatus Acidoferrum sp.]|nr:ATP-binding protein [Candidatus Acidoferrum sp.]
MWAWRKREDKEERWRGPAQAGLFGASREELVREAIHALSSQSEAERLGVWLEPDVDAQTEISPAALRGAVWEPHGEPTPGDWQRLSLEPPLPQELATSTESLDQELNFSSGRAVIGPLVGLRHALWTPIRGKTQLHGVILTGSQNRPPESERRLASSIAAQLALALDFQEEEKFARVRREDLRLSSQILGALSGGASADTVLSQLASSCTEANSSANGLGAAFTVIGQVPAQSAAAAESCEIEFGWESGDAGWTGAIEREPLSGLWREALRAGHVVGVQPPAIWQKNGLARLVAIPLKSSGEKLGVLVAGVTGKSAMLATLERLELRATLAAMALERRRQRGETLRRAARRKALLDASPDATVLLDLAGNISGMNRSAKELLGDARSNQSRFLEGAPAPINSASTQYTGGPLANLFCEREKPKVEDWSNRMLSPGGESTPGAAEKCEAELLNGIRVRLHSPLAIADGLAAVVLSPAALHQEAAQDSRSHAELENVLEWVEEGIVLFAADQTITAMNTRFGQIAGLTPEEASSCVRLEGLIQLLAGRAAEPEAFARRWRELASGEEGGTREELQLARPVPRVLERSVRPVQDHNGRRLGRLEIYRDLTAQRVFQAKLLQTEKLAALGQMVSGVVHELSNPLTSILGYSQRLLVRKDPVGRTEEARQIYEEAERASTILRQLLLTVRDSRPERKRVALNQVVQRAMELQRFGSAAEKISIELVLDPLLPFVTGDTGQLQQVLTNLIGNARQAIAEDGRPGTITLRTARAGENRVLLQVIDDGPGIPQAILARIFDPFFTTKPAGIGTGLGLSIVLGVVREHGGQVSVANAPGGGAVFSIELPAAVEYSAAEGRVLPQIGPAALRARPNSGAKTQRLQAMPRPALHTDHRKKHVLIVEDEPTVARLIADVLEDEGMQVDMLLDGREALERAARESYDLVICDMKMPGLDGQHFYQALARSHNPLRGKFLFVTGDVIAPQTHEFLERHSLPHVAKPFRVEELTEKVFGILSGPLALESRASAFKKGN